MKEKTTRKCYKCKEIKNIEEFYKGNGGYCKKCQLEYDKEYQKKNEQKLKEYKRLYFKKNQEKLKEKFEQWKKEHPEEYKEKMRRNYQRRKAKLQPYY